MKLVKLGKLWGVSRQWFFTILWPLSFIKLLCFVVVVVVVVVVVICTKVLTVSSFNVIEKGKAKRERGKKKEKDEIRKTRYDFSFWEFKVGSLRYLKRTTYRTHRAQERNECRWTENMFVVALKSIVRLDQFMLCFGVVKNKCIGFLFFVSFFFVVYVITTCLIVVSYRDPFGIGIGIGKK